MQDEVSEPTQIQFETTERRRRRRKVTLSRSRIRSHEEQPTECVVSERRRTLLYELCEKSLREHDAIETYKKAVKEGTSQLPEGEQARNTNNAVLMSFVTQMCFFPGPNNVDDVENASSEEKRQAEEWSKKQTQYCKGERREERVQNFSDHSLRASNILEEVKRKALTDALKQPSRNHGEIEFTSARGCACPES